MRLSRSTPAFRAVLPTLTLLTLAACGGTGTASDPIALGAPEITRIRAEAPPGATPGTCWDRDATPAVIETVTEQILVEAPQINDDGTVVKPASYRTETRQQIVKERHEIWFRTPCEPEMTPIFIASLQRALEARGLYSGPITGEMDAPTRRAVRAYQRPEGLDSGVLSLAAARRLGLAVVEVPGADEDMVPVPATG
ncbi:peptidoglycan-binding domain-containing protein [Oceanicola sp. 22II-s10i]|uniref:peptidoglycan-binding domain-containing protein n=1 Tax=Oceanicola sp. 22II-s10i TaxID=1317116 RepID=UPI000B520832|nr:peptidoglycan-binding domain-containing protein [Oceanicola sp. 22II-s10i]